MLHTRYRILLSMQNTVCKYESDGIGRIFWWVTIPIERSIRSLTVRFRSFHWLWITVLRSPKRKRHHRNFKYWSYFERIPFDDDHYFHLFSSAIKYFIYWQFLVIFPFSVNMKTVFTASCDDFCTINYCTEIIAWRRKNGFHVHRKGENDQKFDQKFDLGS